MSSRRLSLLASLVLAFPLAACGGATLSGGTVDPGSDAGGTHPPPPTGSGSGSGQGGIACYTDGDCRSGQECAWSTGTDWCAADDNGQGTCVTLVDPGCELVTQEIGCDCPGKNVTWTGGCGGLPGGYAPEQLAHAGACEGTPVPAPLPVSDAGAPTFPDDAGVPAGPCSSNSDCPTGNFCGYPIGACGSSVQCLPEEEMGLCNSVGIYCGCNGMNVVLSGCAQAATVPVAHVGACPGTDAGF